VCRASIGSARRGTFPASLLDCQAEFKGAPRCRELLSCAESDADACWPVSNVRHVTYSPGKSSRMGNVIKGPISGTANTPWELCAGGFLASRLRRRTTWEVFTQWWDDFCCANFDDVLIVPDGPRWPFAFHHEDWLANSPLHHANLRRALVGNLAARQGFAASPVFLINT
jgi:hypothetical protein